MEINYWAFMTNEYFKFKNNDYNRIVFINETFGRTLNVRSTKSCAVTLENTRACLTVADCFLKYSSWIYTKIILRNKFEILE